MVKVTADPDPRNKGDKKAGGDNIFMVYLDVLSIDNGAQNQDDKSQVSFTMLEMKSIAEIFDMGMYCNVIGCKFFNTISKKCYYICNMSTQ